MLLLEILEYEFFKLKQNEKVKFNIVGKLFFFKYLGYG